MSLIKNGNAKKNSHFYSKNISKQLWWAQPEDSCYETNNLTAAYKLYHYVLTKSDFQVLGIQNKILSLAVI